MDVGEICNLYNVFVHLLKRAQPSPGPKKYESLFLSIQKMISVAFVALKTPGF